MIDKKNIKNIYALSPMQQGMLLHSVYDDKLAYFEQVRYHISGQLNVKAFCDSWSSIVTRHDIFRTIFVHEKVPQPIQIVFKTRRFKVVHQDISQMNAQQQKSCVADAVEKDRAQPFNLTKDMLMRIELFKLAEDSFEIIWSFHHILMDGWSLGLIQNEFFQSYEALSKGKAPQLTPVMPYGEYIKYLKTVDQKAAKNFWCDYLKGFDTQSSIPKAQVKASDYQAAEYAFELSLAD